MDTDGNIKEHSKIKLDLYKLYLEEYLRVLLNTPHYPVLEVHDIFSGSGIALNNEEGSAIVAAKTIKELWKSSNRLGKKINLRLNENNAARYKKLLENTKSYNFVITTHGEANSYIQSWKQTDGSHNLFMIDPFGYSQVSPENLSKLFNSPNSEILIFIPVYAIYRFLSTVDPLQQPDELNAVAKFLDALGIDRSKVANIHDLDDFIKLVTEALKTKSNTNFVYVETIKNQDYNNIYGLFFITHNVKGGEKFLVAQEKLKQSLNERKDQPGFFFADEGKKQLIDVLQPNKKYTNKDLYRLGIENGLLPKFVTQQLKKAEADGHITVSAVAGEKRFKGGYYITNDKIMIEVSLINKLF